LHPAVLIDRHVTDHRAKPQILTLTIISTLTIDSQI